MDDSDQPARPLFTFGPGMQAMLLVALCFGCIGIFQLLSGSSHLEWLTPSAEKGNLPRDVWKVNIFYSILVFGVPALLYANIFPPERFGFFRLKSPVSLPVILFGSLAMILLWPILNQGATWLNDSLTNAELIKYKEASDKYEAWAMQMPDLLSLLFSLFANALIPAVFEELLFRGSVQKILSERTRTFWFWTGLDSKNLIRHRSILTTAFLFSFFHFDPIMFPLILLGGLMLGYAYYWTGSLRLTIAMHFLFNGTSIVIEYLAQHNPAVRAWDPGIPVFVAGIVGTGLFMTLLLRRAQKERG